MTAQLATLSDRILAHLEDASAVGDSTIVLTPDGILLKHGSSTIMLSDAGVSVNGQRIDLNK